MKESEKRGKLCDRLREALNDIDKKPIDLSKATGIPKSMISYYLAGKSEPKVDRVYDLAEYLGVSEAWLMGYDVPKNRTPEQVRNDKLAKLVVQARKDADFFELVSLLVDLPSEQYNSIKTIIQSLSQK